MLGTYHVEVPSLPNVSFHYVRTFDTVVLETTSDTGASSDVSNDRAKRLYSADISQAQMQRLETQLSCITLDGDGLETQVEQRESVPIWLIELVVWLPCGTELNQIVVDDRIRDAAQAYGVRTVALDTPVLRQSLDPDLSVGEKPIASNMRLVTIWSSFRRSSWVLSETATIVTVP